MLQSRDFTVQIHFLHVLSARIMNTILFEAPNLNTSDQCQYPDQLLRRVDSNSEDSVGWDPKNGKTKEKIGKLEQRSIGLGESC